MSQEYPQKNASNEQRTFSGPVEVQLYKDKAAAQQHLFPLASGIVAARPFFRHRGVPGQEG